MKIEIGDRIDTATGPIFGSIIEYADGEGARALVRSECPGFARKYERAPDGCKNYAWASATFLEGGLPAALGAGPFWGKRIPGNDPFLLSVRFLGELREIRFEASQFQLDGHHCVRLESNTPWLIKFDDQRFFPLLTIPRTIEFCHGEAFPRSVVAMDGTTFILSSLPELGGSSSSLDVVDGALAQPPSGSRITEHGHERHGDPIGLTPREASAYFFTNDPTAQAFLRGNPSPVLRTTFGYIESISGVLLIESSREVERYIEYEGRDGATVGGVVKKKCLSAICTLSIETAGRSQQKAPTSPAHVGMPFSELWTTANETLHEPITLAIESIALEEPDQEPLLFRSRFIFTFMASVFGDPLPIPRKVQIDGGTGLILSYDLPQALDPFPLT